MVRGFAVGIGGVSDGLWSLLSIIAVLREVEVRAESSARGGQWHLVIRADV